MSYLLENYSENVAARITHRGRQKIAQGNFNIEYFQIGDSEFDYGFPEFDGEFNAAQRVLMPMDKDNQVKYPYKVSESSLTGTTYGTPVEAAYTHTITNEMPSAGFVGEYTTPGPWVHSNYDIIDISELDGSTSIDLPSGDLLSSLSGDSIITVALSTVSSNIISGSSTSFVYRVTSVSGNTVNLDRSTPDLSSLSTYNVTVINNGYYPHSDNICLQGDAWVLNTIWESNPAGLDPSVDEKLSGYTSNVFVSTKEYFGYHTSSGQTYNTGTTITNSLGDVITVSPEEQHSLSLVRFPRDEDIYEVHDLGFKYEDYLDHSSEGVDYFEVYIPYLLYERNTTATTTGATFYMGDTDYYINSSAEDTRVNQMKYRNLLDENGNYVGKVFVNQKLFVFDDQEIVAALDYKSNRRYTLPIPRISRVPVDSKCDVQGDVNSPLLSGTTGETVFVTYLLAYTGDTNLTGMHCNHYSKIVGGTVNSDVSITFGDNDFKYMVTGLTNTVNGYVADRFYILAQKVDTSTNPSAQPDPTAWRIIDYTDELTLVGGFVNPADLRGTRFIISDYDYETLGTLYDLETYMGSFPDEPSDESVPEFGDEQPFPGSILVIRGSDIEVLRFFVNLPSGYFETTQNPSYVTGVDKRLTEVALLDANKEVLVIGKMSSPIVRTGTQVVSVKVDL